MSDENEAKNYIIDKVLGFVRQTDQHHLPKGTPLSSFYFTSEAVVCICLRLALPSLYPSVFSSFFYFIFIFFCIRILFYTVWFDSWPENFQFVPRFIWPFLWHRTFWVLASWIRFNSSQHCQCCFVVIISNFIEHFVPFFFSMKMRTNLPVSFHWRTTWVYFDWIRFDQIVWFLMFFSWCCWLCLDRQLGDCSIQYYVTQFLKMNWLKAQRSKVWRTNNAGVVPYIFVIELNCKTI